MTPTVSRKIGGGWWLSHSVVSDSCNCMDCSMLGFSVPEISQTRILERLHFPTPVDLPDTVVKDASPVSPALAGRFFTTELPGKPHFAIKFLKNLFKIRYVNIFLNYCLIWVLLQGFSHWNSISYWKYLSILWDFSTFGFLFYANF